jgi:hypothetical protein
MDTIMLTEYYSEFCTHILVLVLGLRRQGRDLPVIVFLTKNKFSVRAARVCLNILFVVES